MVRKLVITAAVVVFAGIGVAASANADICPDQNRERWGSCDG
jgi:hypothetical protein